MYRHSAELSDGVSYGYPDQRYLAAVSLICDAQQLTASCQRPLVQEIGHQLECVVDELSELCAAGSMEQNQVWRGS
jgi:hypothetical protein